MNEDYLDELVDIKDYDYLYKLKCQKDCIIWSGFKKAPDYDNFKKYVQSQLIDNPHNHLFFLRDGKSNEIMGYVQYNEDGNGVVEGRGMALFKKYQGCGLASLIDILIVKKAKECGFKYMYGWCSEKNLVSKNALIDAGFRKTTEFETRHISSIDEYHTFYKWEIYL